MNDRAHIFCITKSITSDPLKLIKEIQKYLDEG